MSQLEAEKIARNFAKLLKKKGFPLLYLYLFGSYTKGKQHKFSDIDIAVVSRLKKYTEKREDFLWSLRHEIDDRIEPHYFTSTQFKDLGAPLVYDIRKNGIKVS